MPKGRNCLHPDVLRWQVCIRSCYTQPHQSATVQSAPCACVFTLSNTFQHKSAYKVQFDTTTRTVNRPAEPIWIIPRCRDEMAFQGKVFSSTTTAKRKSGMYPSCPKSTPIACTKTMRYFNSIWLHYRCDAARRIAMVFDIAVAGVSMSCTTWRVNASRTHMPYRVVSAKRWRRRRRRGVAATETGIYTSRYLLIVCSPRRRRRRRHTHSNMHTHWYFNNPRK